MKRNYMFIMFLILIGVALAVPGHGHEAEQYTEFEDCNDAYYPKGQLLKTPNDYDKYDLDYQVADVARHLREWVVNPKQKRYRQANETAQIIVDKAALYDQVQYQVLSVVLESESSYHRDVKKGKRGEFGMGQFMPKGAAWNAADKAGIHIDTWQKQIEAVAHWLNYCLNKCNGDLLDALNAYQSKGGRCQARTSGARKRFDKIQKWLNR